MTALIYIADPMCSWCYGFGPELSGLLDGLPEVPIDIMVGGLRAYWKTPMNDTMREELLSHWRRVQEASGLPFNEEILSKEGFIYDTEPACRAVVTARTLAPAASLAVFQAIQHGFYAEGKDVTKPEVLAEIAATTLTAAGFAIDAASFQAKWAEEAMILATHADFSQVKKWGVDGFPTLVLERNGKLELATSGYLPLQELVDKLQAIVDQQDTIAA